MFHWPEGKRSYIITFENGSTMSIGGIGCTPEDAAQSSVSHPLYCYHTVIDVKEYTERDDLINHIEHEKEKIIYSQEQIAKFEQRLKELA